MRQSTHDPWTSTTADYWRPTYAYIDIDPGENTTWNETLTLARLYRTALEHLSVRVLDTGSWWLLLITIGALVWSAALVVDALHTQPPPMDVTSGEVGRR